jgi:predicted DsbA family dithiol-disulfide isomerase
VNPEAEAKNFAELWSVDGPVLIDEHGQMVQELSVRGVPTNIFVGADGIVREVGAVTPDELEAATRRLLGDKVEIAPPTAVWTWHEIPED